METKSIINEIFESYNEIFIYSSEYQHTYFGAEFVETLKKVRDSMVISVPFEPIGDTIAKELVDVEETDRFKYTEFEKIRRSESFIKKEEKDKEAKADDPSHPEDPEAANGISPPPKKLSIE